MAKTKQHKTYLPEFKEEALILSQRVGVAKATRELGVYRLQVYYWRSSAQNKTTFSERESGLAAGNARLKPLLADQVEALEILKK